MRGGAPSRTAERVALRRAAHQLLDQPAVFDDPLALTIVGTEAAAELRATLPSFDTPPARRLRVFLAVRSRYAEDHLAVAIGRGVRQYVILGAGLDTYAYRPLHLPGLRIFEVDHPATQAWKRERLRQAAIAVPDSLTFVPVDFERQNLSEELAAAGFRADQPAFFSWLGVVMYLTLEAATATLRFIASLPPSSGVTFDYAQTIPEALAARLELAGEPFQLVFRPDELAGLLRELGFRDLEDLGPEEMNARYFDARADGLRVSGQAHVITAWV